MQHHAVEVFLWSSKQTVVFLLEHLHILKIAKRESRIGTYNDNLVGLEVL